MKAIIHKNSISFSSPRSVQPDDIYLKVIVSNTRAGVPGNKCVVNSVLMVSDLNGVAVFNLHAMLSLLIVLSSYRVHLSI